MNRREAMMAMLDRKEVTSDEFEHPDETYCIYSDKTEQPFWLVKDNKWVDLGDYWDTKTWRLRKYLPKDKELVWCYYDSSRAVSSLGYYDAKNKSTFNYMGKRKGITHKCYAPFNGTPPPNICKPEDLED